MYVTRPLSLYIRDPAALSLPPPEGPNSGYLLTLDKEAETHFVSRWSGIRRLPFPQNKNLTVSVSDGLSKKVMFIPVINQPLSANIYYVIKREGQHQGKAIASSEVEDVNNCCLTCWIQDVTPNPLDPFNVYQQFKIIKKRCGFIAESIPPDGLPPQLLRSGGWDVYYKTPKNYHLNEALGLNSSLRAQLPNFNFLLSNDHSEPLIVGNWYCPFMFVKESGVRLKDQMKMSVFYKMILEQRWEKIFTKENSDSEESAVLVDVVVQTEVVKVAGRDALWNENDVATGVLWFKSFTDTVGAEQSVGLSLAVVERMKWEQERAGWTSGNERQVRLERVEKFGGGTNDWKKFGCYVLVESFVLKGMDGSLVLTYDYKHTHQIRCKWE